MFLIFRILISCLTAGCLIFFLSLIIGEDLVHSKTGILKIRALHDAISYELNGNIDKRINVLGDVPQENPYRKFYCIELVKEIYELYKLIEKQRVLFDNYNVSEARNQLKRIMGFAESSNVAFLMDELENVKEDLKKSAVLLGKVENRLVLGRITYLIVFFVMWIGLYLYFSRGILFKERLPSEA